MKLLLLAIYLISGALIALGVFGLIRNECIYRVRIAILDFRLVSDAIRLHCALPSYGEMLHNPRYWLLWTKEHWMAWLARHGAVEAS